MTPVSDKKHLSFQALFVAMLISSFSYALVLPALPFLVLRFDAGAEFGGLLIASHALSAAVTAPLFGWISDRVGRRVVICAAIIGTLISYVVFAFSDGLFMLLGSRILAGLMAGDGGVIQAAAADQTEAAERGKAMNLLTVAWALGFVVGPAIGAVVPVTNEKIGFWYGMIAAGATAISFLVVLLFPTTRRRAAAGDIGTISAAAQRPAWSRYEILLSIGVVAMSQTGLVSMTGFWAEAIFAWTAHDVSLLFFWVAACIIAAQLFLLPRLTRGVGEPAVFLSSFAALSAGCVAIVLYPTSAALLILMAPVMFCGVTISQTLSATFMSRLASNQNQGAVMGVANGTAAVGRVAGPMLCGALFTRVDATAPYWFVSAIVTLSLAWLFGRRLLAKALPAQRPGFSRE